MSRVLSVPIALAVIFQTALATPLAQLPEVETVLTKATGKMQDFAAEASAMQAKMAEKQKASREALANQKKEYEGKLEAQAANVSSIEATNADIEKRNAELEKSNANLESATKKIHKENDDMRDIIKSVHSKVEAAQSFLTDSLHLTDDSDAEELKVLETPAPKPTLEHFLEVAKGDESALLQMQITRKASDLGLEDPGDLVQVLQSSMSDIDKAEKEGAAELKAHFLTAFEAGVAKIESLMSQQKLLKETTARLEEREGALNVAKVHLEKTREQLQQRLHGLRVFARKVDAAAYTGLKSTDKIAEATAKGAELAKDAKVAEKEATEPKAQAAPQATQLKKVATQEKKEKPPVSLMAKNSPNGNVRAKAEGKSKAKAKGKAKKQEANLRAKPIAKVTLPEEAPKKVETPSTTTSSEPIELKETAAANPVKEEPTSEAAAPAKSHSWFHWR